MREAPLLVLFIAAGLLGVVLCKGGFSGGGRGFSGGRSSSSFSSSSSARSSPTSAGRTPVGSSSSSYSGARAGGYGSSSYHPISSSSFTSSLLTSMAVSSMFHHSYSPYSHRYVYVVQEQKAPFRTNVTESRDYYFDVNSVSMENCTEVKRSNSTGDDTQDLIDAQFSPDEFSTENITEVKNSTCRICTYKIDENSTDQWASVEFKDGSRPSSISWRCEWDESCCGMSCCKNDGEMKTDLKWWMIVLISMGSALTVLILIKCTISLRKWCATADSRTHDLAPPLNKLDYPPLSAPPVTPPPAAAAAAAPAALYDNKPLPPAARSFHLAAEDKAAARPASAASLSGVQASVPRNQRKYV